MKKITGILFFMMVIGTLITMGFSASHSSNAEDTGSCKTKVVKCPVSGQVIAKEAMKISTDYKDKTYFFCCENCKTEFEKNPEKYVKETTCKIHYVCTNADCQFKSDKPGNCPTHGNELKKYECTPLYVCPMKECNTKSDKPGKCPKCGMEMKKMKCACETEKKCDSAKKDDTPKDN